MDARTDGIERGRPRDHDHPEPRRRPSGEPPALPHELGRSGKFFLLLVLYFVLVITAFLVFPSLESVFERWDHTRQLWVTDLRTPGLTRVMLVVNGLTSSWTIRVIRWSVILALIVFRRWRHLFVFLGAIIVTEIVAYNASSIIARPRPLGIPILTGWQGYSMPSRPMASLAVSAVGAMYALIVAGKPSFDREVGDRDRPRDPGLRPAVPRRGPRHGRRDGGRVRRGGRRRELPPVRAQRSVPRVLPSAGRRRTWTSGGRRGEAIVTAIRDQLGLSVLDVKPVGLEASGGSTPLRIKIEATDDEPERYVFAKLYAKSHVRADRWYKLGRTILYGALEDEKPFQSVRRFVEYEDYTLRLLHELGIPVPRPYGIVEITPEREYMIVMEFFEGAVEIGDADIDDGVIDQGLGLVRKMWDEGLAHRDVKPANLMVRDGELKVIDVFFVQVRPSPWRQAVDLANMMLVLALRSDAERVYAHALTYFSEDEIAEAFAAARGVASPTQLRNNLKQDGRDLLAEFRRMAPEREQVSIQRWSVRRVLLTIGVLFAAFLALGLVVSNWNAFA